MPHNFIQSAIVTGIVVAFFAPTTFAETRFVNINNCPGPGTGSDVDPFCMIQDCVDASMSQDECFVASGTYNELIDFTGKAITLQSTDGPADTIIDGGGLGTVVKCVSNEGPDTVLRGFTITGGVGEQAGGMWNEQSSPTVVDCIFSGNVGGVLLGGSAGGMLNKQSSSVITGCVFINNQAAHAGGMSNYLSGTTVTNCSFFGNSATNGKGGGMVNGSASHCIISNCLFAGNSASDQGGGMYLIFSSYQTVANCTFVDNTSIGGGGGLRGLDNPYDFLIANNVFWNNQPNQVSDTASDVIYSHNLNVPSFPSGEGNIEGDPLFVNPTGIDGDPSTLIDNDYRLAQGSPCIDSGKNDNVPSGVVTDLDGLSRLVDDPATDDTGIGSPPIVDLGAFEFRCGDGILDIGEQCDFGADDPNDCCSAACRYELADTVCGDGPDGCSDQDACDGSGNCIANDLPFGTVCGAPADMLGSCFTGDLCSGGGVCVPGTIVSTCIDNDLCCNRDSGCNSNNDNDCDVLVPTTSSWGLLVLTMLLGIAAKLAFRTSLSATQPFVNSN